ncbi:hypothetical protein [[Flexibacter] sp. ATCC 35208]|uniref:hypothetical protein n=1 Tax=[Flexibacter] sp. ATCC 35208 TaxID=1936242 RepID=UPI0009D23019|nr:hypothetical protein [[Flexibacter] sp. ATCC 35208]OMP74925.1 hypothetical protein BW716_32770 [[Flexibacter] sp. ATCC 35208]
MENQSVTPSGPEKNKGGHPKGKQKLFNHKVTFYLSDEEYSLLTAFVEQGWHDRNYSGAARFLLLKTLV